MAEYLFPLAFAGIIAFGVFMYVLMDGFDLGVGILFPTAPTDQDRDVMMNSVAPIWDGNETWLVLGGAVLFGAFPLAYGVLLSGLYLPLLVMLVALVFRGVAFEFRFKANKSRFLWDIAFSGGSVIATFAQGIALGAFIQGFAVENGAYAGSTFDWLTPFSVFTGAALIPGYALLGATWLVLKTQGPLQDWAYDTAMRQLIGVVFFMGAVSIGTLYLNTGIVERWFSWPSIAFFAPVPVAVALGSFALYRGLRRRAELSPFILSMFLFWLGYSGLAISIWPNIIPHEISIWTASSPIETQEFMIWGFVILIPIILSYTAYSYWVFRGKVTNDGDYH